MGMGPADDQLPLAKMTVVLRLDQFQRKNRIATGKHFLPCGNLSSSSSIFIGGNAQGITEFFIDYEMIFRCSHILAGARRPAFLPENSA